MRQADAQAAASAAEMRQVYTGKLNKEELNKLEKEAGDPEPQIKALLTPDQGAAYQSYQQDENAHNARATANLGMLQLRDTVDLTTEQQDRAFAALYQAALDRINGNTRPTTDDEAEVAVWRLDQETKALEPVLTPPQLDSYRQRQATQAKAIKDIYSQMQGSSGPK